MKHWVEGTFSNLRIGIIPWEGSNSAGRKSLGILPIYQTDLVEHKSNCGNYSVGHRGHDVQETHKKDVVGIKTARTCHVTIIVSHFVSQFKKILFRDLWPSFFQVCFLKILSTNRIEIRSYNTTRFLRSTRNTPKDIFICFENQPSDQYAWVAKISIKGLLLSYES